MSKAIVQAVSSTATTAAAKQRCAVLMLLAAAFFWGSGNIANKSILQDLDPFAAAALRNVVAALALAPFALREFLQIRARTAWLRSALPPSVFFAGAIILQQWGYQSATVTNASFLVNVATVITPILAFFVLKHCLQPCIVVAAVLTLIGAFLMSGATQFPFAMNKGDLACLGSALFYGAWMVALGQHAARFNSPAATTCLHSVTAMIFAALIVASTAPLQPGTIAGAMPELIYLGVFSSALAFGLTAAAQAHLSASTTAVLVAAESLFGAAGAIAVLGERPSSTVCAGGAMIGFAILIAARSPGQAIEKPPEFSSRRLTQKGNLH